MSNILAGPAPQKRLAHGRFALAETRRNIWHVVPDGSTAYVELFDPNYWRDIAPKLRPFDRIEVAADDGSYFAVLMVLSSSKSQATVQELKKLDISPKEIKPAVEEFAIKWRGPHAKHAVIRVASGAVVKDGFETADDARGFALTIK